MSPYESEVIHELSAACEYQAEDDQYANVAEMAPTREEGTTMTDRMVSWGIAL